jgi:DUF4097 and DUF4098 domain-containing protein YvlB
MNRSIILAVVLLVCFVPGCQPGTKQYTELESHILDAANSQSIIIKVDHGEVIVFQSKNDHVEVGGQVLLPDEVVYQVSSTEKQISIKANANRNNLQDIPLRVEVHVPKGMLVQVETDSASVLASNYQGDLEVDSTSGKITIEQIIGKITLWSNRGNIIVRKSSGNINVAGNYGVLNVQNVHGETAVSTIMGNVVFDGLIQSGDVVRLETDHGPVSVNLNQASDLSLQVGSISGDVACMVPDISSTTRTCTGEIGAGEGTLKISTVSGAVTLQLTP